jgi:hypothetical protein
MKTIMSRRQIIIFLSVLSVLLIGSYAIALYLSNVDNYLSSHRDFSLTVWQAYTVTLHPLIQGIGYGATLVGVILAGIAIKKRSLLSYGVLSLISGVACLILLLWS